MEKFKINNDVYIHFTNNGGVFKNEKKIINDIIRSLSKSKTDSQRSLYEKNLRTFACHLKQKLKICHYKHDFFKKRYANWLNCTFTYSEDISKSKAQFKKRDYEQVNVQKRIEHQNTRVGPKEKPFNDCKDKQKRRRIESLQTYSTEMLTYATKMRLKSEGNVNVAKVLDHIINKNEEEVKQVLEYCKKPQLSIQPYTKEKALALYMDAKMSKHNYNTIRFAAMEQHCNLYPSYFQVQQAKSDCYPPNTAITVTESYAKIDLQALLDHTTCRIFKSLSINTIDSDKLTLLTKWGCDGASNQSQYKQRFANENDDDGNIFLINIVPIKLYDESTGNIIWVNISPSSTRFCRPVKFRFTKENTDVIKTEVNDMNDQIDHLRLTQCIYNQKNIAVKHKLIMTMVDGKVINAVCGNVSSMRCHICNAKPTEMNKLDNIYKKEIKEEYYKYGMSTLHAWIRCFECLLHISYNQQFKSWSARSESEKEIKNATKKKIQAEFRRQMGLNVDIVTQGTGTSNDGNTARRFFDNPSITSSITGLNENLIRKFAIILQTLASGYEIDPIKFSEFTASTAADYVKLYNWYYMPASVHKILIHGADIIRSLSIPIGLLSEEAQEARNKEFKKSREDHTRKCSRIDSNMDLLHILLISSDPYISSLRRVQTKNKKTLFPETLQLLILPNESEDKQSEMDDTI